MHSVSRTLLATATLALALGLATPAHADKDPSCKARCVGGPPDNLTACLDNCPEATAPPPPRDAGTKPKDKPPAPPVTVEPPRPPAPSPDAGPSCKENEALANAGDCVCAVGYGRPAPGAPCIILCKDGELRTPDGKCAPPPAPPAAPPPPAEGNDWWWILLVLLILSMIGNIGLVLKQRPPSRPS